MISMTDDVLIKCEHVSKKFCRGLKRSLWYGLQDICAEFYPLKYPLPIADAKPPVLRKDEFWAVNDISFELKRGECLGLIGHNGAGKSTLLKILNGLIKPDHGRITMKGRIGALIELNVGFNPVLTGRENVYIYGAILGFSKEDIDRKYDAIVEFSEMSDFMEMPFMSYSSGMKVRLGFAVAAQMEPDVLIIDEVLAVGDVGFRSKCFNVIGELCRNAAVILVSHSMQQISRISSEILVMQKGTLFYHGPDIVKGINYYVSSHSDQIKFIGGNGRAKISDIRLRSSSNNLSNAISYSENLIISMAIALDIKIKEIVVNISFLNLEMQPVAQSNSKYNKAKLKRTPGLRFNLNVEIEKLTLSPGAYYVSISLLDNKQSEVYAQYYAFQKIEIKGDFIGRAPIQLNSSYQIC